MPWLKINNKESRRKLVLMPYEDGFILSEKTQSSYDGKNHWDEQKVFISREELEFLANTELSKLTQEATA